MPTPQTVPTPQASPASRDSQEGPASAEVAALEAMGFPAARYTLTPVSGLRRRVAQRLTEAARDIPHYSVTAHLNAAPLLAAQESYNTDHTPRASINDHLVAAAARALVEVSALNASFTPYGILRHKHADICVAVAIEGGIITPIIRAAETCSLSQIIALSRDLAARARSRRLQPDEYHGGTFCISNLGMYGVSSFTSILNPPQGAILSVGSIEDRAVPVEGVLAILPMMTVTLTCDHRVIDGAIAAQWLKSFKAAVAAPGDLR